MAAKARHNQEMRKTEETAYKLFFRQYYPKMHCYARRMVGEEGADEVVLDVFVDIWKRFGQIDVGDSILGYLYRAVYRRSLNYLRDNRRQDTDLMADIGEMRADHYLSSIGDGERDMENSDMRRQIDQAVAELPGKCREAFVLSYVHGLKNKEIAMVQGVSQRTVDAQIYKALKYLRQRLRGVFVQKQ